MTSTVFAVGLLNYCRQELDDVDHFADEALFFTTSVTKAVEHANSIKHLENRDSARGQYVGIVLMEYDDAAELYVPVDQCLIRGVGGGHIGVQGITDFDDLVFEDTHDGVGPKLYAHGVIADMQYFMGGWFVLSTKPHIKDITWCAEKHSTCDYLIKWNVADDNWKAVDDLA